MKRLFIPLLFLSVSAFGQFTKPQLYTNINTNIRLKTASQLRISAVLDSIVKSMELAGGSFTLTNGNGTTASGSAVNLGGSVTSDANINYTSGLDHAIFNINVSTPTLPSIEFDVNNGTSGSSFTFSPDGVQLTSSNTNISFQNTGGSILFLTAPPAGVSGDKLLLRGNISGELKQLGLGSGLSISGSDIITSFSDPMTTRGDVIIRNASNVTARLGIGGAGTYLSSNGTDVSWATPTASASLSGLTAATGTNTINNADHAQEWQWNTLGAGTGLLLSSSSTAAASNTNTLFRVNQTGANATTTQTTNSGYFSNTKTGTLNTNVGIYAEASGGATANYAIRTGAGNIRAEGAAQMTLGTTGNSVLTVNGTGGGVIGNFWQVFSSTTPFEVYQAAGSSAAGTRFRGATATVTVGTHTALQLSNLTWGVSSGTGTFIGMGLKHTVNTTGTFSGTHIGFDYDPTLTSTTGLTQLSFRATSGDMLVPASSYHNWGTTSGTTGYGFRDNAGTMEWKNSGGAWAGFGAGGGDMLLGTIQTVTARKDFNTGTFSLFNPANTFKYNFLGSAIVADRTVTLPLLTGNDTFVMNDFAATLTNKTIAAGSNTITGLLDANIDTHTTTKISTTSKSLLNSAIVYTDQINTFGDFNNTFRSTRLRIANPANTFSYSFTGAAIAADRVITLPLLTGGDVMVTEAFTQTLTNKTIALGSNTVSGSLAEFNTALTGADFATGGGTASGTNTGDQSLANTSDATSHTVTLTGGTSVQLIEGSNITLTTGGTGGVGTLTIASSGGSGLTYAQVKAMKFK